MYVCLLYDGQLGLFFCDCLFKSSEALPIGSIVWTVPMTEKFFFLTIFWVTLIFDILQGLQATKSDQEISK